MNPMNEVSRHLALEALRAEDRVVNFRFKLSVRLGLFGIIAIVTSAILCLINLAMGWGWSLTPFMWVALASVVLSASVIMLSALTSIKAAAWRARREVFWDTYGYRTGEF